jgi:divalent metal cation (Fe/Co/Zn/Cd) transporter
VDDLLTQVATAAHVGGVLEVSQVRVRRSGPDVFVDVTREVDHGLSLEAAHDLAELADVVLHAHPVGEDAPGALIGQPAS